MHLNFVLTNQTLTILSGSEIININRDHVNFKKIVSLVSDKSCDIDQIRELAKIDLAITKASAGKITVTDDGVYYNDELIHNAVVDAIFSYQALGLPIDSIVKFLDNLMQNPSKNSIDQLWNFIDHHQLPLTEDGCILAYKAVRPNYMDKFSGKISNHIGAVIKMDRNKISDDPMYHCAAGLHVGGLQYSGPEGWYSSHGDKCIIVKVNPKNVVCVPNDHGYAKVRTCEYEVVKDYTDILKPCLYDTNYDEVEGDEFDDIDEFFAQEALQVGDIVSYNGVAAEVLRIGDDHEYVGIRMLVERTIHTVKMSDIDLID